MKKKFFRTLSALAVAAVLALNVTVVLDDNATSYLKFDTIGNILAQTTSGSTVSGGTLPEATIICSKGPDGDCYTKDESGTTEIDCSDGSCGEDVACSFSGSTSDCCDAGPTCD